MRIMLIETATEICSLALVEDGKVLAMKESSAPNAHSTMLPIFVKEIGCRELDAVCVSSGPGSYTGLRIGVSTAKGICYALGIPLLSVPTLQSMASLYHMQHPDYRGYICPMIDARRMECYTLVSTAEGVLVREIRADIVVEGIYDEWLDQNEVVFIGNGATKTRPLLSVHPHARFDDTFAISAVGMISLAEAKMARSEVEDVAYFEPYYLKDFVAKKSVVHGLR